MAKSPIAMYSPIGLKDGVRGARGGFNGTHLTARIPVNTQDIKT